MLFYAVTLRGKAVHTECFHCFLRTGEVRLAWEGMSHFLMCYVLQPSKPLGLAESRALQTCEVLDLGLIKRGQHSSMLATLSHSLYIFHSSQLF